MYLQLSKLYLLERYETFNNGNDEDRNIELKANYIKELKETLEIDSEKYEQLEAEAEKNKKYISKLNKEIQQSEEKIAVSFDGIKE